MAIVLKSRREIELMRTAGKLAHDILLMMTELVRPGVSTADLDDLAERELQKYNAIGLSKNYPTYKPGEGFPASTCISINEEVVHGIPSPHRVLKDGDIVTLDITPRLNGYCARHGRHHRRRPSPAQCKKAVSRDFGDTRHRAVKHIKPGIKWSDIARLMQYNVEKSGFSVVREFVGHGVGHSIHEDPKVPNFVISESARGDFKLRPGMTLAVEPMVVAGRRDVQLLDDGWTVITEDKQPAAHFEHTIAVTETGVDILTDGRAPWAL